MNNIVINNPLEDSLIKSLNKRDDVKAERIKRLLKLPDLTKKKNSPVKILVDQIKKLPRFVDFDLVDFPKIVSVKDNFDLLNTPKNHPSRKETDTYYLTDDYVLRTHTTPMWSFYLREPGIMEKLEKEGEIKALSAGTSFRKDEIDRNHFPAFHQVDFLYISKKAKKIITIEDLKEVKIDIAQGVFGQDIEYKFVKDTFPFTDPSIEMNIKIENGDWVEVTGGGLVHPEVLKKYNLDPKIYNGWAFSFGIERLAMLKMGIGDIRVFWSEDPKITSQFKDINSQYKEVSKYPATFRDISFIIDKSISLNEYYEIIRDLDNNLVEEVKLIDEYQDKEKFGENKKSYTFRITYQSPERTLTNEEVNKIQEEIRNKTERDLQAILR